VHVFTSKSCVGLQPCWDRWVLAVIVKSFSCLTAEISRRYHFFKQVAGSVPRVPQLAVQRFGFGKVYVYTDEVYKLQRSHWLVCAQLHGPVYVLGGTYALFQYPYRLVKKRCKHP